MQQLVIACGINPIGALIELIFWIIGIIMAIWFVVVFKAWAFPRSQWVNRRAPILKSFMMLMTGATVSILVMTGIYFLAPTLLSNQLGSIRQYHLVLLLAICIHDALAINYWLKRGYAQTLSLGPNQQMQVDPARSHWYQPWLIAFSTNLLIFFCALPVFALAD